MEIDQSQPEIKTTKKKCHGNRKLYHFKRKCRARGMTEEQITALIKTRNNDHDQVDDAGSTVVLPSGHQLKQKKQKQKKCPNKRKRTERNDDEATNQMNKSMSQLSVSQPSRPKKLKAKEDEDTLVSTIPSDLM
jgi:DNA-binding transcriptional MerR regulator